MESLRAESFDEFQNKIESILEEMNSLESLQRKEKALAQSLRAAEQALHYETSHMDQEVQEKGVVIKGLNDQIQKLRSEKSQAVRQLT